MHFLRLLDPGDVPQLTEYFVRNRAFHREWSPRVDENFYTDEFQRRRVEAYLQWNKAEREYRFGIFWPDGGSELLIGLVNLVNIVRGVFLNGCFGYSMDEQYTAGGIMSASLAEAVAFAYNAAGLHRVEANIMPRNEASRKVLQRAGFRHIGFSPRMLCINGVWEDHDMYAMTVEEWVEFRQQKPTEQ